jgi:zinc transport system substrate-binding protein
MSRIVFALIALVLAAACGKHAGPADGKPRVAVSIFPLYDVTRRIAGDRLDVILVLPPGKSEHAFDPTPKEIARLSGTKLAIAVGLDLDAWIENVMKTAGSHPKVLRVGDKVQTIPIEIEPIEPPGPATAAHDPEADSAEREDHDDHALGAPDPHVWMDPERMIAIADAIAEELASIDPAGKTTYVENAATVKASLEELDAELTTRSKAWSKRTIVTFHGSMSYFARRYGLVIAAVVEPVAGTEPTATYLAEVVEAIERNHAAALFTEPQLDKGPARVIAEEARVPLGELDPVGGVPGRDSYEALMRWNADQLDRALR